ncbi:MAG: pyrroloquinoline quinone-dependent dehydrogenase [Terriglobia bacterium]|nr:MAG: pyrroloquinoline quinone-dependent dehydrogenase [Terriglobia bacterium]
MGPLRFLPLLFLAGSLAASQRDWPGYGGGPEGIRYSPLSQIRISNVRRLHLAWSYDTADGTNASQTQPIVVHGVLFGVTPKHKVIALNADTGKQLWRFDSGMEGRGPNRGVVYWSSGSEERVFASVRSYVYALDARTGEPISTFGDHGRIDLRQGLGRDPEAQSIVLTTPGVVYQDLLIVGGRTPEVLPAPPGDIRAYDVRTGALRWAFHTIPHPGEYGYATWPADAWTYSGSANNWAGMALDEKRGIVYVPIGSAATDFYGANRIGDNLFANTLLALDARSGRRIWHFQAVKHDIWDRDFPSPPALVTLKRNGKPVDSVAQVTKHGWVYIFDRSNGTPLFPVEYRRYPPSLVPGESAAETQPLPVKPEPFARQLLTKDLLSNRTPAIHEWALGQFQMLRSEGQFVPLGLERDTVVFPGFDGGAEWGGTAFDPGTGLLYVNANEMAWTARLAENPESARTGVSSGQPKYRFAGFHKWLDPDGYPAVAPPWGTLSAIDLNTGNYAWRIPLGEYPELAAAGTKGTGTENYGGPIVTAGGLLFIAATDFDRKFRAFDKRNGRLLWETTLPMAGNATPITYEVDGKQYVVIYATGGKGKRDDPSGGIYLAFSLPNEVN